MSKNFFQKIGPGLLYAGAAIGVSHLVQSTRAGANFGVLMGIVVILANLLKFPFFQYGPQFAHATGKSLVHGYKQIGKWAVITFLTITIGTAFIIQAAVTMVTTGIGSYLIPTISPNVFTLIILAASAILLGKGKLQWLNKFMKVIMLILSVTTIVAFISSFGSAVGVPSETTSFSLLNKEHFIFLIAFIGWMPAPIDISVWYSVWALENKLNSTSDYLFDFKVGYIGTALLAICFVGLGANMLHQSGIELSSSAVGFSKQLIEVYTNSIGDWAGPVIGIAAFTTMLSTTISVMDGISRVLSPTVSAVMAPAKGHEIKWNTYTNYLMLLGSGTLLIIFVFAGNMRQMVDFATTLSFVTAPVLAYLNIKAMQLPEVTQPFIPSKLTVFVSYAGLILLTVFALLFLLYRFVI